MVIMASGIARGRVRTTATTTTAAAAAELPKMAARHAALVYCVLRYFFDI